MTKKKTTEKLKESFGKLKDDNFQFDLIKRYFANKDNSDSFQTLSDKTCNDIDFEELFMFLDRTTSKVGQQYLYNNLRVIPKDRKEITRRERLIKILTERTDTRVEAQLQLNKLNQDNSYYISSLFQVEYQKAPKWLSVIKLLPFASLFSLVMIPFIPQFFILFLCFFIINLGIHYWNKRHLYKYLGSIPQLIKLNRIADNFYINPLYSDINPDLPHSIKTINQIRNRMSFFRLEANIQNESDAIFWGILELFKIAFLLEPILLFNVLDRLNTKRTEIENVFCFVGEIDIATSVASLRKGLDNYCLPTINDSEFLTENIYHPLIPNCITNSIETCDKSILLTGSNMSGKTSFIRCIALNAITGLSINTCFAQKMIMPQLRIYSAIRINDDLMNDKSYYFEEVLTIKEMIEKSSNNKPNLFLLDEIFKGTNTTERISAGKAVLSTLAKNNNIVFVSTHDIELADMLSDEYKLYHFSEIVKDNNVDFDYKLKDGKLKHRNAIRILQINNYPKALIAEATKIAENLDKKTPQKN